MWSEIPRANYVVFDGMGRGNRAINDNNSDWGGLSVQSDASMSVGSIDDSGIPLDLRDPDIDAARSLYRGPLYCCHRFVSGQYFHMSVFKSAFDDLQVRLCR